MPPRRDAISTGWERCATWSTWSVTWCSWYRSCSSRCNLRRAPWQSVSGDTSTCAASAGKPLVTVQTWRSCTSTTSGSAGERACDLVRVDAGRRPLEEDPARLAEERPARAQAERGDGEAGDRVEAVPAGREHERTRDRGAGERREIGRDVQERAAHVQALAVGARQHERRDEVHGDADERDDEHDAAVHVGRRDEPAHGAVDDPDADEEQRDPVRLRGEDLGASEPERPRAARGARREPRGDERSRERRGVGEHVPRVGEQRERARDDAGGDLARHQADDQDERDREQPAVR